MQSKKIEKKSFAEEFDFTNKGQVKSLLESFDFEKFSVNSDIFNEDLILFKNWKNDLLKKALFYILHKD